MTKVTDVIQSPLFVRQKKKLKKKQIQSLDEAIKAIIANPVRGESKIGDLQGVRVYKFRMNNNQILLAYEQIDHTLYLYAFGVHANFYKSLKKYRKK
ncbi:MAG: type II toxin-antitoxin system RelE/ParE family toxin [Desulfobulbaceae bacterium]|nr:type II toxin-antitoxin system RelE/ParE family toxin [Desulfobulbaceae bacterium]MCK5404523.1 type II toxin-antitoxin system RelE/ParE family toxin [Desulfobulbaceae bacterium]